MQSARLRATFGQEHRGDRVVAVPEMLDPTTIVAEILAEHGPLHEDDIAARLRDRGVADADAVLEKALDEIEIPARQLADDRWLWLPAALAGRVFTHRLNAGEAAHDMLTVAPDLSPLAGLCEYAQYARFADGSAAQVVMDEYDDELLEQRDIPAELVYPAGGLLLAPGTLAALGVAEGDLVGLRLDARGLVVERVTAVVDSDMGARFVATVDPDEPVSFESAVLAACVEDPAVFTEPLAPLRDIIDDYGLALRGDSLATSGFDFDRWRFELGCTTLAERYDIERDEAVPLYGLVNLYYQLVELIEAGESAEDGWAEDGPVVAELDQFGDLVGEFGVALADPLLAELFVTETSILGNHGVPALGLFAEMLERRGPSAARVAARWLRAVALERTGDVEGAEREWLAAESIDPDWPLPLLDLARIASDRGDAERGLALLRRAGAGPDHPLVQLLTRHRTEPRSDLGRNHLCWCGSGRKYKKCHLGHEQLPLAERAGWLYAKAVQHVLLNAEADLLTEVAFERTRYAEDDSDALDEALEDPLVLDAVLFEDGAFEDFLEMRGPLLPDDERLLAEQWLLVDRSVFEVEQVHRGAGLTVRDLRTGDTHEVRERAASRQLKPGQLICARVVPAGDTMQFFGGLEPVALHERDPLIELLDSEPDAVTLVAQLSLRFAPPVLTNTEGDPLAICEATVRVDDPAGIESALDNTYDRADGEEPPRWVEHVTTGGMARIRATLVLDGETLRVAANSEERMDRVLEALTRLDIGMSVLDDSRTPMRDIREADKLAQQVPGSDADALDADDPEVAAILDEFIRTYETKWLEEPIPALDGYTPRQAADDPTRRDDLLKLLQGFPAGAAGRGVMDADRLRAALGLT
jgi:SEC-C motif